MTLQNKIRLDVIIATFLFFSFIAYIGFGFNFSKSEGTLNGGYFVNFIADYIIYLYPCLVLCIYVNWHSPDILLFSVGVNILLYAVLLERLVSNKLKSFKYYKPFHLTEFVMWFLGSFILIFLTYSIIMAW